MVVDVTTGPGMQGGGGGTAGVVDGGTEGDGVGEGKGEPGGAGGVAETAALSSKNKRLPAIPSPTTKTIKIKTFPKLLILSSYLKLSSNLTKSRCG